MRAHSWKLITFFSVLRPILSAAYEPFLPGTSLRCPLQTIEEQDLLSFTNDHRAELEILRPLLSSFDHTGLITPYPVTFPIPPGGQWDFLADQRAYRAKACVHIREYNHTSGTGSGAQTYLVHVRDHRKGLMSILLNIRKGNAEEEIACQGWQEKGCDRVEVAALILDGLIERTRRTLPSLQYHIAVMAERQRTVILEATLDTITRQQRICWVLLLLITAWASGVTVTMLVWWRRAKT